MKYCVCHVFGVLGLLLTGAVHMTGQSSRNVLVPVFRADPSWPMIPNNWVFGEVSSIAVDSQNHVWIIHRPNTVPADQRPKAAPPVLEFDSAGKLITSWGGPGAGYDWPEREHGIYVDPANFVWIGGNNGYGAPLPPGDSDDMLLKFTTTGKFVLQIGHRNSSGGNADTSNLHQPADSFLNRATNEIFVADGYGNQRVIVFDAGTGAFKRMWGAFGNKPESAHAAGGSVRAEGLRNLAWFTVSRCRSMVWCMSLTVPITAFRFSRLTENTSRKNLSARWDRLLPALHSRLMAANDFSMSRI